MRAPRLVVLLGLAPLGAAAAPVRLQVAPDPAAEVRFLVEAPLDFVPGLSHAVSGWAELDPDAPSTARASVAVDLNSFETGIDLRDEDLRDQFFETARYKEAVLTVKGLERLGASTLAPGREIKAEAVASFSLHGVERDIRFPVSLRLDVAGERMGLAVNGGFRLALRDYHIRRPSRLFLKIGEHVDVAFRASFRAAPRQEMGPASVVAAVAQVAPAEATASAPAAGAAEASPPAPPRAPARPAPRKRTVAFLTLGRPEKPGARPDPAFRFSYNTPEGRGERMFRDGSIGGEGNALSCASCHSASDERFGLSVDGTIRPDRTLYGSARRPRWWQGMAPDLGKGASICAKWFMLKPEGLEPAREADLAAYLAKISPDPAPALDYRVMAMTRRSDLPNPLGGDPRRGQVLEKKFCAGCHGEHEVRSPLTPGLYEADDLVRRVRWLPGTDARQMPPIYVDRLPDSDLRDIVTYLVGDDSQRIFKRKGR